jgi:hypothetical protein
VRAALSRLGDLQHRRVFFERLKNPLWVAALEAHHAFDSVPGVTTDLAGMEVWTPWPEGEYLVRMAPVVPEAVSSILARASDSANPYVRDVVLRAALELPSVEAEKLVSSIEDFVAQGVVRNGAEVVALIEKLAADGSRKAAVRVAQAAFRPRPAGEPDEGLRRGNVVAGLESYWYEELLPRAVAALDLVLGDQVLTTLARWLEQFQEASGDFHSTSGGDSSYLWRPAIGNHSQNSRYEEPGDSLVEAVRDRAVADLRRGRPVEDVLAPLERSGRPLLSRIGMYALAATAAEHGDAIPAGYARLTDSRYLEVEYRHEYAELSRAILPRVGAEELVSWEELVLNGPPLPDDELEQRARRSLQPDEQPDGAIARYRDIWQLNVLSAIGRDYLPAGSRARLDALVETYGEPSHADFPTYSFSWTGPNSPVTEEDLTGRALDDVKLYLSEWEPEGLEPWEASKEGLARTLQAVVSRRASEFSSATPEFADLNPTYVRALFSGLSDGLNRGAQIDWAPVLEAAGTVANKADDGAEFEGGMDEDVIWRFAQRATASLIERGSSPDNENAIPAVLLSVALEVLAPLVSHPDPTPEHEERYGGSNMDPLTLSLNTTRPSVVRAVVRVATRARSLIDLDAGEGHAEPAIVAALTLLESRLKPTRDFSLATAAAFGESLGRLAGIDRDWTVRHSDALLSDDPFGEVVLSTALAAYRPARALLDVVASAAQSLLDRAAAGATAVSGWRTDRNPVELVGDHLVLLRVQGVIEADHPLLSHFFEVAPVRARSRVLGHLGWLLMKSDEVSAEALERAMSLWDARATSVERGASVDELAGFYWWVGARKFDPEWWLPRLQQASRSSDFDPKGMLGEVLEETAVRAPAAVAAILEQLLSGRGEPFARYDLVEHAPGIIAAALDSGDPQAVAAGERTMDSLGRTGHLRIAELVELRRGRR